MSELKPSTVSKLSNKMKDSVEQSENSSKLNVSSISSKSIGNIWTEALNESKIVSTMKKRSVSSNRMTITKYNSEHGNGFVKKLIRTWEELFIINSAECEKINEMIRMAKKKNQHVEQTIDEKIKAKANAQKQFNENNRTPETFLIGDTHVYSYLLLESAMSSHLKKLFQDDPSISQLTLVCGVYGAQSSKPPIEVIAVAYKEDHSEDIQIAMTVTPSETNTPTKDFPLYAVHRIVLYDKVGGEMLMQRIFDIIPQHVDEEVEEEEDEEVEEGDEDMDDINDELVENDEMIGEVTKPTPQVVHVEKVQTAAVSSHKGSIFDDDDEEEEGETGKEEIGSKTLLTTGVEEDALRIKSPSTASNKYLDMVLDTSHPPATTITTLTAEVVRSSQIPVLQTVTSTDSVKNNSSKNGRLIGHLSRSNIEDHPLLHMEGTVLPDDNTDYTFETSPKKLPSEASPRKVVIPPVRSGYMYKQGHMVKNWKKRFFVVEAGILTYYNSHQVETSEFSKLSPIRSPMMGLRKSFKSISTETPATTTTTTTSNTTSTTTVVDGTNPECGMVKGVDEKGQFDLHDAILSVESEHIYLFKASHDKKEDLRLEVTGDVDRCDWASILLKHIEYRNNLFSK